MFKTTQEIYSNDKYCKVIVSDKDGVIAKLQAVGVKTVAVGDELGDSFNDIGIQDELTLLTLPLLYEIVEADTEKEYRASIIDSKNKYLLPYKALEEHKQFQTKNVLYYKEKNLLVALLNPFANDDLLQLTLESITESGAERIDVEKAKMEAFKKVFIKRVQDNINEEKEKLDNKRRDMESAFHIYTERTKSYYDAEQFIKDFDVIQENAEKQLIEQMQAIKEMGIVKDFGVDGAKITFTFPQVYVNYRTTVEKDGGVRNVKRKTLIGDLKMYIDGLKVYAKNLTYPDKRYPHPHHSDVNDDTTGHPCLGTGQPVISEAIAKGNYAKAVKSLYSWAININMEDGWSDKISHFQTDDDVIIEV